MSERDPRVILDEMLQCIALIRSYTTGLTAETFEQQQALQDAIVHRIEILGEAASQLPDTVKSQHTDIPWRVIVDMRNRLIHGYFAVRLDLVWQVATTDIPALETQLHALRDSLP
ncbi:MAG TPA: DUF86 domain-containing protein [Ktedonobacterales bacterium]